MQVCSKHKYFEEMQAPESASPSKNVSQKSKLEDTKMADDGEKVDNNVDK